MAQSSCLPCKILGSLSIYKGFLVLGEGILVLSELAQILLNFWVIGLMVALSAYFRTRVVDRESAHAGGAWKLLKLVLQ